MNMVQALLDYSRIEFDTDALAPVDLMAAIHITLEARGEKVTASGARIHIEELPQIWGHGALLRRLFGVLIDNAVDHSGESAPAIEIEHHTLPDGDEIAVIDHGVTIPEPRRESAFLPFRRLGPRDEGAIGMGLAVAQRIATLHGGRVRLEETPGGGTTALVFLPRETPDHSARPRKREARPGTDTHSAGAERGPAQTAATIPRGIP